MSSADCIPLPLAANDHYAALLAVMGDSWLNDYLNGSVRFDDLTSEQQAFAAAFDGVVVGMLDANLPDPNTNMLQANSVRDALTNDGWVSQSEWQAILNDKSVRLPNGQSEALSSLLHKMGPEVACAFREVSARVVAGMTMEKAGGVRYVADEVRAFLSPRAVALLEEANRSTLAPFLSSDPVDAAVMNMNEICATIESIQNLQHCDEGCSMQLSSNIAPMQPRVRARA